MKYSKNERVVTFVNIIFMAIFFVGPLWFCFANPQLPADVYSPIFLSAFFLFAFLLADWYYFGFTDSYSNILKCIFGGILAAICLASIAAFLSSSSVIETALLRNSEIAKAGLFRLYVFSCGVFASAIISLPRLFVISLITKREF